MRSIHFQLIVIRRIVKTQSLPYNETIASSRKRDNMFKIFGKKKKPNSGIEFKNIRRLEEGFFENFDLYYNMYTGIIRKDDYRNVDNVAVSLMKVYNSQKNIDKFFNHQKELAANKDEELFLLASKTYLERGCAVIHEILRDCNEGKAHWKDNGTFEKSDTSAKLENYLQLRHEFAKAKVSRDNAYEIMICPKA